MTSKEMAKVNIIFSRSSTMKLLKSITEDKIE
jgi:hypothetical protein